jgi:hypothetical protein
MASAKNSSTTQVRIGISQSNQELNFECDLGRDEVQAIITKALDGNSTIVLGDTKGHTVMLAASKVAFVELGSNADRKIGFTTL